MGQSCSAPTWSTWPRTDCLVPFTRSWLSPWTPFSQSCSTIHPLSSWTHPPRRPSLLHLPISSGGSIASGSTPTDPSAKHSFRAIARLAVPAPIATPPRRPRSTSTCSLLTWSDMPGASAADRLRQSRLQALAERPLQEGGCVRVPTRVQPVSLSQFMLLRPVRDMTALIIPD